MQFKKLHDGRPVPVLGIGTAGFGDEPEREERAVRAALAMGFTHIDTAEGYGGGIAEEVIGRATQGFERSKLFLTTKVSEEHLLYQQVLNAIEGTLRRLRTEYVDLYLIHWPNPRVPLDETFQALNELVAVGKVRYIGVSNFSVEQMERSFRLTSSILATNQVRYSLFHREPEENGVLQYCQDHDMLLTAYTPVEHGRVAGHARLNAMAREKGVTATQLALAWLITKPSVITIPESKNDDHLRENLGSLDVTLSSEEMRELDALSSRHAMV